tara:strand:+ start:721 stop:1176 length:456 start_codon:yes stop_codon:yes gene_type:complete
MPREPEMIEISKVKVTSKTKKDQEKTKKPTINTIYESTLETLKEKISVIAIRPNTIHLVIKYVMESVEYTPLKGSEQKELALKLIRAVFVDFTDGEDERVLVQLLEDGTISNMIDLIVDATKGKLDINTVALVSSGCINSCLPYLFSRKRR